MPPKKPKLLRPTEAAEIIGVSKAAITQAMDDGRLDYVEPTPGVRLLKASQVEARRGTGQCNARRAYRKRKAKK